MRRSIRKFTLAASISLVVLCLTLLPATAQENGFTETFDDPELANWEHSPEVIASNGVLRIGPANFAARMGNWSNFQLGFKLRFTGAGATQVNFRSTDQNRYSLIIEIERLILIRVGQGTETELDSAPLDSLATQDWLEVQINAQGGNLEVRLDGTPKLSITDSQPLTNGGLVFFSHGERTTEIDDISLTPLAGEAQPGEQQLPVTAPQPITPTLTPAQTGSWQALLDDLSSLRGNTIEISTFAINLLLAVITSFILSRVYIYWGSSLSNRRKFAANFMLVTVTTTFIILVVRSSVALSLGLVGALSIIRFRAAIKEPEELAYLFFAIGLGIGLGDNQRLVTLLSLLVVILVIGLMRLFRQENSDMNLHLALTSHSPNKVDMQQVQKMIEQHCSKMRLLRFDENPEILEMNFVVEFRHLSDLENLRTNLQTQWPSVQISFLDNKGVW